jgi:hypothetical protein
MLASYSGVAPGDTSDEDLTLNKLNDIVIYHDDRFFSAFPSIVRRPLGELLLAFRRAPDRRVFGESSNNHTDAKSHLVLVRSEDNGKSWSREPELIYAHPFGGSQDPCLVQLQNGTIVCSSYGWARIKDDATRKHPDATRYGNFVFMGGYLLRSEDGGHQWSTPIIPPAVPGSNAKDVFGDPCSAYNRGAMCEGEDGRLYWAVVSRRGASSGHTETHLMTSDDGGRSWEHTGPIAQDEKVIFNETSLYMTPRGDLLAFMRTENHDDHTVVARSTDKGRSFGTWQDAGWKGHPHHALRLPDDRVLLTYGYRHPPFGIRARVLNAECTDFDSSPEIVLRDDGLNHDLGYPWGTLTADGRILVVYYFHDRAGTRYIAGTYLGFGPSKTPDM